MVNRKIFIVAIIILILGSLVTLGIFLGKGPATSFGMLSSEADVVDMGLSRAELPNSKGYDWDEYCSGEQCIKTIYPGSRYNQNLSGNWVDSAETFKIKKSGDNVTFAYQGYDDVYNLTFGAGVMDIGDNYYTISEVKALKPNVGFDYIVERFDTQRKYSLAITNLSNASRDAFQYYTLDYIDHEGFQAGELKMGNNSWKVRNFYGFFDDLTENGFTVEVNKSEKRIYIGNFSDKYTLNTYGRWDLLLDPTVYYYANSTSSTAWKADVAFSRPPGSLEFAVETAYNSGELDDISADDANSVNSNADWAGHRVKYFVNINPENINDINSTMDAECYSDSDICAMYVWNFSDSDWDFLTSHSAGAKQRISYKWDSATTNFSEIINDSIMYILVQTDDTFDFGISDVDLYYAQLEVNYSGTPDVMSLSPDNDFENLTAPTTINFTCNASDEAGGLANMSLWLSGPSGATPTLNSTTVITGASNQTNWSIELGPGEYTWYCRAYNDDDKYADSTTRWTYIGKDVYNCDKRTFDKPNIVYMIMGNMSYNDADPCIDVLANNITFDLGGYALDGNNDHNGIGIRLVEANDTLIYNGIIYDFLYNIYVNDSHNNEFYNLTLGEPLVNSIRLIDSNNNVFDGFPDMPSQQTFVDYLSLMWSDNNNFSNFVFETDDDIVALSNSTGNYFMDGNLSLDLPSSSYHIVSVNGAGDNYFVNVSFNSSNAFLGAGTNYTRQWWYRAYVNDTGGNPVNGANVTATDVYSVQEFVIQTDGTGFTPQRPITDYFENTTAQYYSSNYLLEATNGTDTDSHSFNSTLEQNELNDIFTLRAPLIVTLDSPANDTQDNDGNITFTCSASSGDGLENITLYHNLAEVEQDDFKIQRGNSAIAAGATTDTLTAGVDYDAPTGEAFIRIVSTRLTGGGYSGGGGTQEPEHWMISIQNPDNIATSVIFERTTSDATWDSYYTWEIIEYIGPSGGNNEMIVRNATTISMTGVTSATSGATSGIVDDDDVVVFITGQRNDGTSAAEVDQALHTATWNHGADTATFTRDDGTDTSYVSYAIVEFTGSNWVIQNVSHTQTAAGPQTETIPTTLQNISRAFLHVQTRTNSGNLDEQGVETWISSTTQISFERQGAAAATQNVVAWVIENTQTEATPMSVQHFDGTRTGGTAPDITNVTINTVSSTDTTAIFAETATSTGGGTAVPRGALELELVNTTDVQIWTSDAGQTQSYRFDIVQFPTSLTTIWSANQTNIVSGDSNTTSFNITGIADNTTVLWNCLACDSSSECSFAPANWTVIVNFSAPTDEPPYWSNNQTSIVAEYNPIALSYFNITWQDDFGVDTVYFESNYSGSAVNYTITNSTPDVYNYSANLPAGNHYWRSWANDTLSQTNLTDQWDFTIAQNSSYVLDIDLTPSDTETYPTSTTADASGCPAQLTCNLYRDGALVSDPDTQTLAAGTYNYTYNTTGNANYTAKQYSDLLTINQNAGACDVLFNETSPKTYPYAFTVWTNCNSDFTLLRDGTPIANNSVQDLPAGTYNFTVYRTDTQNYSNTQDEEFFTINKETTQCLLDFDPVTPITYPTAVNVSCVCDNPEDGRELYRDGINVTDEISIDVILGAATYNYTCNSSETQNYSAASNSSLYTVNKATSELNLTLDNSQSNISIEAGDTIDLNCSLITPASGNLDMYNEGALINSGVSPIGNTTTFTTPGLYNISCYYTTTQNYTADDETWFVDVTDTTIPELDLFVNATVLEFGTESVFSYCNVSDLLIDTFIYNITYPNGTILYEDLTANASVVLTPAELTVLGNYTFSCFVNDTSDNYNSSQIISVVQDTTTPSLDLFVNATTLEFGVDSVFSYCNASDLLLDSFIYNVTYPNGTLIYEDLTANASLTLTPSNLTVLGNYTFYCFANDTSNNYNSSQIISVVQDTLPPDISNVIDFNESGEIDGVVERGDNISFNATVVDVGTGTDSVWVVIWQGIIGGPVLFWDFLTNVIGNIWTIDVETNETWPIGDVNYTIYANDSQGTESNQSGNFTIQDTIIPDIQFVPPTTTSGNHSQNYIEANVTSNSPDLDTLTINLYNATEDLINTTSSSTSPLYVNYSGLADGTYYLNATVNDTAGNSNNTETRIIILDATAPTVTIDSPEAIDYTNATIDLNVSADEAIDTWVYSLNGGANQTFTPNTTITGVEGSNTIIVCANDSVNNIGCASVSFDIDTINPNITIENPIDSQTYDTPTPPITLLVNITATDTNLDTVWFNWNGTNVTYSSEVNQNFPEGTINLVAWANDTFGNIASDSITFYVNVPRSTAILVDPINDNINDQIPYVQFGRILRF